MIINSGRPITNASAKPYVSTLAPNVRRIMAEKKMPTEPDTIVVANRITSEMDTSSIATPPNKNARLLSGMAANSKSTMNARAEINLPNTSDRAGRRVVRSSS